MARVFFWSANRDGASWYRGTLPANAMSWNGHVTHEETYAIPTLMRAADVIVGSRVATPEALVHWRAANARGTRLVLDLDDDYFAVPADNAAGKFWAAREIQAGLREAIELADVVTVASEELGVRVAREVGPPTAKIRVIPNGLHAQYLGIARDYDPERLTIGWAGTAMTMSGFPQIDRAFCQALRYRPATSRVLPRGLLIGMQPQALPGMRLWRDEEPDVEVAEWIPHGEQYLHAVRQFDIWLAPYEITPFNLAKFPTKALEASMLGIPLIATDFGPYDDWIDHGRNGFLVPRHAGHQWSHLIKALLDSPDLRRSIGEGARSNAARYTLQQIAFQWEQAIL